jgi:hypothetical protein
MSTRLLAFVGVGYTCIRTGSYCEFSDASKLICIVLTKSVTKHISKNTDTYFRATCYSAVCRNCVCVLVYCATGLKSRTNKALYFILKGQNIFFFFVGLSKTSVTQEMCVLNPQNKKVRLLALTDENSFHLDSMGRVLYLGVTLWRKHSGPVRTSVTFHRSTFLTWPTYDEPKVWFMHCSYQVKYNGE